jgi:ribonuclease Z
MLTRVRAGPVTVVGVSVGGVYTSLLVPEFDTIFDVGIAPRSFVGAGTLLISHGHADHVGSLGSLIGQRGLARLPAPTVYLPEEIEQDVAEAVGALSRTQRRPLEVPFVPMVPLVDVSRGDLWIRPFRTLHSVPSLGYALVRKVQKLRDEFRGLGAAEIVARKAAGQELFRAEERIELAYVTDSLIDVLDSEPWLLGARVLILECTFTSRDRTRAEAREKMHVHLDEIVERAETFRSEALVLMHFSQSSSPSEVRRTLDARVPPGLRERLVPFVPDRGNWPG